MRHALRTFLAILFFGLFLWKTPLAQAYLTAHPFEDYSQAMALLKTYHGDPKVIEQVKQTFARLIDKHPSSPFGYLGMSQLNIIEAYRCGQHYNIKMITQQAMPMALKAMHYGPTLSIVHDNYGRFENIFKLNDERQDEVKRLLTFYPQKPQTYFAFAEYLSDQGDFEKSVEYYKISLRFANDDAGKLKALKRIAQIYSDELQDAQLAREYLQEALAINPNANNQNTALHCQFKNLYYTDDESKNDCIKAGLSQR